MKIFFIFIILLFFVTENPLFSQQSSLKRSDAIRKLNEDPVRLNNKYYFTPLILEQRGSNPLYLIGPEVNTQLSGYHDFQTNGECKHYVNRVDQFVLHSVYMYRSDSGVSASRRTGYSFSTDGGSTFIFITNIPSTSSGHPSLTVKSDGSAVICNYYSNTANAYGGLHYDIVPGAGTFTTNDFPAAMLFPGCARLSNNNIFSVGIAHPIDTITSMVYNTTTNTFGSIKKLYLQEVTEAGMVVSCAAGPGGKVLMVLNPYADVGGNFGMNRLFLTSSSDNGVTWSSPSVLYNPSVINGDTVVPFFGLDAIYDNAGNYYVAFNSISPSGSYSTAKMWVTKNGGEPSLVAQHSGTNGIPEAANTVLNSDAGICTIDHPSLSLSADGLCIYTAYAVQYQNDTLNGYNKCHIYVSYAKTSDMAFGSPVRITNAGPGSFDERFPSLNQVSPDLGGNMGTSLFLVYQKDPQPGSCVNGDNAPISRSYLVFRNIYDIHCIGLPGIKSIGTEIPGEFVLYQNFPNPFNPDTKIRFDVPVKSEITVNIYDALGRLVTKLAVNESVSPGKKELSFSAGSLASGIYYYSIAARSESKQLYIETKKMVLIK